MKRPKSQSVVLKLRRNALQKSRQAVAIRAQLSSSEGGSSQKKARRGSGVKASSQGIFRPETCLKTIFCDDDESEEEGELVSTTSLHHRNQRNKVHAVLVGIEVLEEPTIAEESATTEEPRAMEET